MIKTSTHFTNFSNKEKQKNLSLFINEYRRISSLILDEIWENGYDWEDKNGKHRFSIQENKLYFPSFIDYKLFDLNTFLTARVLSSLTTQLCGEIKAEVEKQRKRLYKFNKMKEEGKSKSRMKQLIKKIKQNIPQKPNSSNINPELSSKCLDWSSVEREFDGFLRLKSITKDKMEIKIPVKFHRHSNKLKSKGGIQMNSYLISKNKINIRWNIPETKIKKEGKVIGFDQGKKDIISSSDKQVTPKMIMNEWRFIIGDGKVLSGSLYKNEHVPRKQLMTKDSKPWLLTQSIADEEFDPDPMYSIDICEDVNHNLKLMEIGSFCCAGLYDCEIEPIIECAIDSGEKEFKDYLS